jgi:hypothetical protein
LVDKFIGSGKAGDGVDINMSHNEDDISLMSFDTAAAIKRS